MFAIYQFRIFSSEKANLLISDLSSDIFEDIAYELLKTNNLKMQYEITWIIVDITFKCSNFSNFLMSENFILPFYELMIKTSEYHILKHMIWIFGNLLGEPNGHILLEKVNFSDFIIKLFQNESNIPSFFKDILFWVYGKLYIYGNENFINNSMSYIPIVIKYISFNINDDIFREALEAVYRMCETEKNEKNKMNKNIHENNNSMDVAKIYKIINSIAINYDDFIEKLLKEKFVERTINIIDYLKSTLPDKNKEYKELFKNILNTLENLIDCKKAITHEIVRSTLLPRIFLSEVNNEKSLDIKIWKFFEIVVNRGDDRTKTEIIRFNIIEKISELIGNEDDTEILFSMLSILLNLLQHGNIYINNFNIIKNQLQLYGMDSKIELLMNHEIEYISNISWTINKFFNKDIVNN